MRGNGEKEHQKLQKKIDTLLLETEDIQKGLQGIVTELDEICNGIQDIHAKGERSRSIQICLDLLYNNFRDRIGKSQELYLILAMGKTCESLGEWQKALSWYRTAVALSEELRDLGTKAETLYRIGKLRVHEGKLAEADQCFDLCSEIGERKIHDEKYIGFAYNGKGLIFMEKGAIERAERLFFLAQTIAEKLKLRSMLFEITQNQGILHMQKGESEKAISLFVKNLIKAEKEGNVRGMAKAYHQLGVVYHNLDQKEKSTEYLERSLDVARELGDLHLLAKNYLSKGDIYRDNQDLTLAAVYYQKALKAFSHMGDDFDSVRCLRSIGNILMERGHAAIAQQYLLYGLRLARSCGDLDGESKIEEDLKRIQDAPETDKAELGEPNLIESLPKFELDWRIEGQSKEDKKHEQQPEQN